MVRIAAALSVCLVLTACGNGTDRASQSETRRVEPVTASPELLRAAGLNPTTLAKSFFGAKRNASSQTAAVYGNYSKGCLAGAVQLPETGPTWQAMRLSRNRNWGHPVLIDFIKRLTAKAAEQPGWNGLYVGDMSQPRGGPMLTGHVSHQNGLDVDIWMKPAVNLSLSRRDRENLSSISTRRANGAYVNRAWSRAHHEILKAAASDPEVTRIFVFAGAKAQMCQDETGDKAWLRKIRPWFGHHYHFHVRLRCPTGAVGCVPQEPPPEGDGCAEAAQWVRNIIDPLPPQPRDPNAPPPAPRREAVMGDLPEQCVAVLTSD